MHRHWLHELPPPVKVIIDADPDVEANYTAWVESSGALKMRRYFDLVAVLKDRRPAWFLFGDSVSGHIIRHKREAGQDMLLIEPRSEPIDYWARRRKGFK